MTCNAMVYCVKRQGPSESLKVVEFVVSTVLLLHPSGLSSSLQATPRKRESSCVDTMPFTSSAELLTVAISS